MSLRDHLRRLRTLLKKEWQYRRRSLKACTLQPTYRCNLRCRMCEFASLAKPGDKTRELSRDEMLKIVDELAQMGARTLLLIGGEPFLRPEEMLAVTARARQAGLKPFIVTNGTLIDRDLAREIVASRLRWLVFSVDGVGAAHDRVRGEGAFERVREGMRLVIEERRRRGARRPSIGIQCTFSRLNHGQVAPLLQFKEEIGADSAYFTYLAEVPIEKLDATRLDGEPLCSPCWAPKGESLLLRRDELSAFRHALAGAPAGDDIRLLKALPDDAYLRCLRAPRRCYTMRTHMFINPYGDVHPCLHMDRYVTGNVRQGGLAAVWQNERHRKVIARLPRDMYPVCSGCCLFRANLTLSQQLRLRLFGAL